MFPATELPSTVILLETGTHCAIQAGRQTHRDRTRHTIIHSGVKTFHNCHHAIENNSYWFKKHGT